MIKPLSAAIACILLAPATSTQAFAQDATTADAATQDAEAQEASRKSDRSATDLDRVIVTGTRAPKAIDEIPGAITVISTEEVKHTLLVTEDATAVLARTVPGYAESSQAMSNSGETLRGRIPLRLFDGVPQGSPLREGSRNGTFTDMGIVGRVEVINGPSASEGIGAAGGIINYISAVPQKEGNETTFLSRYSSQGYSDSDIWKLGLTFTRKQQDYDVLFSASYIDRGISYDGSGRRIGMNTSGSLADSESRNVFVKAGYNFGEDGEQRIQASYSRFKIEGKGEYIQVLGCRGDGSDFPPCTGVRTNTSERGSIFGSKDAFNDFEQTSVQYTHSDFFGGTLDINAYKADQAMRYLPENGDDRQLVKVVPGVFDETTRIFDQSEIVAAKKGLRTSWTRPELFGVSGLELHTGIDFVKDVAEQRLALTDRLWVPPLQYESVAPYAQLSWDVGPVTVSGGFRREDDKLEVDSYTTTAFRNSVFVQGGSLEYKEDLKNLGAIWRIGSQWTVFGAYSEGFTLPNIGIPLRNISTPGQSVDRINDLDAIIFKNKEFGFNWRGDRGAFGASHYVSNSDFGASLAVDPTTNDFIVTRAPVEITGTEATGEWRFSDAWKVTALYSHISGKTSFYSASTTGLYPAGDKKKPLGVLDINPDKIGASATWNFAEHGDTTLGVTKLLDRHVSGSDVRESDGQVFTYDERTSGYMLWDLGVNYDLEKYGKVSFGVENLFDKQYILSWSQLAGFQNYWAGRGRVTSLTYTIKF